MRFLAVSLALLGGFQQIQAAAVIQNLQVEYRKHASGHRCGQAAFQLADGHDSRRARTTGRPPTRFEVKDSQGQPGLGHEDGSSPQPRSASSTREPAQGRDAILVDGHRVESGRERSCRPRSWFETGLMDPAPDAAAWGGANGSAAATKTWCCMRPIWRSSIVKYALTIAPGSTRASFVYGANDSRLMDREQEHLPARERQGPELHQAGTRHLRRGRHAGGKAKLHVYRAGYKDTDTAPQPLRTFEVATD